MIRETYDHHTISAESSVDVTSLNELLASGWHCYHVEPSLGSGAWSFHFRRRQAPVIATPPPTRPEKGGLDHAGPGKVFDLAAYRPSTIRLRRRTPSTARS